MIDYYGISFISEEYLGEERGHIREEGLLTFFHRKGRGGGSLLVGGGLIEDSR